VVIKGYATADDGVRASRPPRIAAIFHQIICGEPHGGKICTSYVERQNLTMRMQARRFTPLTNGLSKKSANPKAALPSHVAWYNLVPIHSSLRVMPAIGGGDHRSRLEPSGDACMINEAALRDALLAMATDLRSQYVVFSSVLAELEALRETVRGLDPTFAEVLEQKRKAALQANEPLAERVTAGYDEIIRRLKSGEVC
jgi:hypothetical protein